MAESVRASGPTLATMLAVIKCVLALALSMSTTFAHRFLYFILFLVREQRGLGSRLRRGVLGQSTTFLVFSSSSAFSPGAKPAEYRPMAIKHSITVLTVSEMK